jgi:hypothetical protein
MPVFLNRERQLNILSLNTPETENPEIQWTVLKMVWCV